LSYLGHQRTDHGLSGVLKLGISVETLAWQVEQPWMLLSTPQCTVARQAVEGLISRKSDAIKKGGEKSRLGTVCYCICKVFL
jgi:hypothetical protein